MLFNTFVFVLFFIAVYAVFLVFGYFAKDRPWALRAQNLWLLAASYFFYGWWEWFFLTLIFTSTFIDYFAALGIQRSKSVTGKKLFLAFSVVANLGLLFTMKYFDFFTSSFVSSYNALVGIWGGNPLSFSSIMVLQNFVLPVGISFYTFQTMSYTIDVYRGQIEPEKDFFDFALFVNYFPQLVAGPIERAVDLLPQLKKPKFPTLDVLPLAAWDILLGYFMKVYVADNLAMYIDQVFLGGKGLYLANPGLITTVDGSQIFVACLGLLMQVYCDFAGYSFIALGTSRLLGVTLTVNFETPEYSRNPIEFWNRWHVTLNRWFRDYIYISLGGSRFGKFKQLRNLFIIFVVSGFWHGANWTFVTWGTMQGVYTVVYLAFFAPKKKEEETDNKITFKSFLSGTASRILIYVLVAVSGVAFRSYDGSMMLLYFQKVFCFWDWSLAPTNGVKSSWILFQEMLKITLPLFILDGITYFKKDRYWFYNYHYLIQAFIFCVVGFLILTKGIFGKEVIYFAF
ncbi:membrane-bound O-acyltransferase family protein [Leptospira kobayashii]|uniref:Membrane-bound O-acyltransferase family protein n=1 Tax=Leptospira kobayashii TaxID=1917830 RepID=A0ABM7UQF3_9LEPT|nr:MBOAT family O-acyltransferase [Leptospira kobayashii]BDA77336.1 membrane-bound O-acyltransferase family protein [Leptospira kobayashii]